MKIIIYLSIILCLCVSAPSWADEPRSILVGHQQKDENLVKTDEAIFIGQFTSLGEGPYSDSATQEYFDKAKVKIERSLKGSLSGAVIVSYSIERTPHENEESVQMGERYIFFISNASGAQLDIKKLLPATNENIARISALIAAQK